ncbi:acyltransferase [Terriglobus albidus]|uniref:Acyltransferase n=1 Tax=Terriglobus albidus TaxID=1592106 RepID=A0A5B9E4Z4_9BACT|nr:acyltransferase [Terriglobus albidus]QEE26859.1 acyltransferase [Terriglobus albidus]
MNTTLTATSTATIAPAKSHYVVLDGLRGVASLMVVIFHTFEAYADGNPIKQIINHGYLAVDFFFLLSGFVIAYAYDDRWSRMGQWEFYKRRLIRLQPMVVMGSLIGAALFYLQGGSMFPLVNSTPVSKMLLVMLLGCTLLPLPVSLDIRGWSEMHPLDGPAWSLFFEYVANIAYAIGLRKLSNRVLAILVLLAGIFLGQVAIFGPRGDLIGGWSLNAAQLHIGFARLLFPFLAGMLLMRVGKRIHTRAPFGICTLLLVAGLALPRFGGAQHLWVNGIYDLLCVIILFPIIVAIGAGEKRVDGPSIRIARFFGDLSYPLYITHYPLIYIYTAWVVQEKVPPARGAVWGVVLVIAAVSIAYACLKLYDEPVRRWLSRRFLAKTS